MSFFNLQTSPVTDCSDHPRQEMMCCKKSVTPCTYAAASADVKTSEIYKLTLPLTGKNRGQQDA